MLGIDLKIELPVMFMAGDNIKESKSFIVKVLIVTAVALLALLSVYIFSAAFGVILLVFMGILLGVLIDGLASLLCRYLRFKRALSVVSVIVLLLIIVVGVSWLIGPRVGEQMSALAEEMPKSMETLQQSIVQTSWGKILLKNVPPVKEIIPSGPDIIGYLTGIFSSAFTIITNLIVVLFIGIYLAIKPEFYIDNLLCLLPSSRRERGRQIFYFLGRALRWWLLGRFSSMAVVGILTTIGLWIVGMNLALSLGILAGLFSFIPFLGPLLSFIPAFVISFVQSPALSIYVIIVYLIVQTIESYFLTPLIDQRTVSNPPALLITMQLLMGVLSGLLGVILASPIVVVFIILIQTLYIQDYLKDKTTLMGDQSK